MKGDPLSVEGETSMLSELDDLKMEIEALERLDPELLRRRWLSLMGRPAPGRLSRGLMLRILAYRHQVARLGDLDRETRIALDQGESARHCEPQSASDIRAVARRDGGFGKSAALRPGTVLEREYDGVLHRVTVTKDGCVWNGQSFCSLSDAARAITGTRWNGPRFFGLRPNAKAVEGRGPAGSPHVSASASDIMREAAR